MAPIDMTPDSEPVPVFCGFHHGGGQLPGQRQELGGVKYWRSLPAATISARPAALTLSIVCRHKACCGLHDSHQPSDIVYRSAPWLGESGGDTQNCIAAQHWVSARESALVRTRQIIICASGATPHWVPLVPSDATVPAVCVPWPAMSIGSLLLLSKFHPWFG
jgi:hypothetical protein